jgi:hypothetical protein
LSRLEWEQRQQKAQEALSRAEFTEQDWQSSRLNARSKSLDRVGQVYGLFQDDANLL